MMAGCGAAVRLYAQLCSALPEGYRLGIDTEPGGGAVRIDNLATGRRYVAAWSGEAPVARVRALVELWRQSGEPDPLAEALRGR